MASTRSNSLGSVMGRNSDFRRSLHFVWNKAQQIIKLAPRQSAKSQRKYHKAQRAYSSVNFSSLAAEYNCDVSKSCLHSARYFWMSSMATLDSSFTQSMVLVVSPDTPRYTVDVFQLRLCGLSITLQRLYWKTNKSRRATHFTL